MSRNGSDGTYTVVNASLTPGATIKSSELNQNFADIGTELTNSVAADGQTPITGALKGAAGTALLPGYSFNGDTNMGLYHIGADNLGIALAGSKVGDWSTTGLSITGTLKSSGALTVTTGGLTVTAGGLTITAGGLVVTDTGLTLTAGQYTSPVGSVGAPTYSFVGDLDTGVYHIGANNIGIGVNGAKVLDVSTTGLAVTGTITTNGVAVPTGNPVAGLFKNLSIKVTTTTAASVVADFVTTTDGTNYQTTALSGTIDFSTNGAANKLDAGTIAIDTWYAIWAIAKSDGTTAALASTSFTSPTLPSGYTYKARVGAVQTIHATATLYGTWQFGRKARYVVGLAQTLTLPVLASGTAGNTGTPTWVAVSTARFAPSTASAITFLPFYQSATSTQLIVAPNNSYGGITSLTNPAPFQLQGSTAGVFCYLSLGELVLESSSIYWANGGTNNALFAYGWEDNL